jgi:hypothetical protein
MLNNNELYAVNASANDQKMLIIEASKLSEMDLLKLFSNEVLAIKIPNYYSEDLCRESLKKLTHPSNIEHYENAPSIGRKGMAFYETENTKEKIEKYYDTAKINIEEIRQVFYPNLSPLDKLRLELQEVWNQGANIENIHNRKMFVGLCRILEPNIDFLPHQDIFHLDSVNNEYAKSLKAQIAVNIYLDIDSQSGGEINLWSFGFSDTEYPSMLDNNSYGISFNKLPPPLLSIKPRIGELILFNARHLHAVRASRSTRVSIACFVGYRNYNQPLTYWS